MPKTSTRSNHLCFYTHVITFFRVHIKIHVPEFINKHTHTKYVYHHDKEPKKNHKGKYQIPHFNFQPYFQDGYSKSKSWKTHKSEKYETETIDNPHSDNPFNKYIVKSTYKVREKLPFDDTTVGYDKEYHYPSPEIVKDNYYQPEKIVDYENEKHDPFPKIQEEKKEQPKKYYFLKVPASEFEYYKNQNDFFPLEHLQEFEEQKEKKKPKETVYSYKVPGSDFDFHKSVHLVDYYLKKNNQPDFSSAPLQEEPKDNNYNEVDYEVAKNEDYDHFNSPVEYDYEKYKTEPEFDHVDEYGDFSNVKEKKVPSKS